jgi:hypothetical protein
MQIAVKHLAGLISEKRNEPYAKVMTMLRCQFAFAAMRSSLVCLRGSRSNLSFNDVKGMMDTSAELAVSELRQL